jgi:inorganic triphosphatase YgiF
VTEELEIKLTLSAANQERAFSWLQAQSEATTGEQKHLVNRYYDTPEAALNTRRAALRVREANGRFVQTLKTQGELEGAAYRRQEWEWPLATPELDLNFLAETPLSLQADLKRLKPVFETNFTRRIVMLDDGQALIECAVDSGSVIAGGKTRPLHEVEFELKSGNPERLMFWAQRLAQACPVFLNLVSKAEQGYHLAGLQSRPVAGAAKEAVADTVTVEEFLQSLSVAWLADLPVVNRSAIAKLLESSRKGAGTTGGSDDAFSELSQQLRQGVTVNQLLEQQALGQCQLALLA